MIITKLRLPGIHEFRFRPSRSRTSDFIFPSKFFASVSTTLAFHDGCLRLRVRLIATSGGVTLLSFFGACEFARRTSSEVIPDEERTCRVLICLALRRIAKLRGHTLDVTLTLRREGTNNTRVPTVNTIFLIFLPVRTVRCVSAVTGEVADCRQLISSSLFILYSTSVNPLLPLLLFFLHLPPTPTA
jgi:hypothetical protein